MVRLVPDAGGGIKSVCVVGNSCGQVLQLLQGRLPCCAARAGVARLAGNVFAVAAMARL